MRIPQFKGGNIEILNKQIPLYEMRNVDLRSLVGLYLSQILLYIGLSLILLNNLGVILPNSYFGDSNWLTVDVFSIGVIINFVVVPWLYFSSFSNFRKENDFWNSEIFWILPLFFFGTFFLYGSKIDTSLVLFAVSIVVIAAVHFYFIFKAQILFEKESKNMPLEGHYQYIVALKYLTAYYVLLLALLIFYDPAQQLFNLIRYHA